MDAKKTLYEHDQLSHYHTDEVSAQANFTYIPSKKEAYLGMGNGFWLKSQ